MNGAIAYPAFSYFKEMQNEEAGIALINPSFWMFPRGGSGSITAGSWFMVTNNITSAISFPKTKTSAKSLEIEFNELAAKWKQETMAVSSLTKIYAHPAYQRIMAMGEDGLPFVLKELQKNTDHWFYALKFMAGKNISEGITNIEDAKAAWLEWGYKNNHI